MRNNTKKLVTLSLFLALAIIVNIVENITFSFVIIPGVKFGLANIASIFILFYYGFKEMVTINLLRVTLASLITGTLFSMPFIIAFSSSLGSMLFIYILLKLNKLSIFGISMSQAVIFNILQIFVVSLLYDSFIFMYYLPYLMLSGVITGYLIALVARYIIKMLDNKIKVT